MHIECDGRHDAPRKIHSNLGLLVCHLVLFEREAIIARMSSTDAVFFDGIVIVLQNRTRKQAEESLWKNDVESISSR